MYSSKSASRSASRIFWIITCLAVWAAIRSEISFGGQGNAVVGPGDAAVLAIDGDHDVLFFAVVLLGGGHQGRFDGLEEDLLVDVLLAVDRIDDPQDFARIHHRSISPCPGYKAAGNAPVPTPERDGDSRPSGMFYAAAEYK